METKVNLELKHFCADFEAIRSVLQELGAQKEEQAYQKDYFFFLPKKGEGVPPRLKLRVEGGRQTLIYYHRPDFEQGKMTPADVRLYEMQDEELLPFLQEILGVEAIVEKTRERWRKNNIVFNLDEVEGIGKIFEIEVTTTEQQRESDEKAFAELQEKFMPYLGEVVKGSNVDLVNKGV